MSNRLPRCWGVDLGSLGEADGWRCSAKLRNASYSHARAVQSMDASGMPRMVGDASDQSHDLRGARHSGNSLTSLGNLCSANNSVVIATN
jgi:hypothetical protein